MSDEFPEAESRAEAAWRKAREADQSYADTLEEIRKHFDVLLELRDRRIRELERTLAVSLQNLADISAREPEERFGFFRKSGTRRRAIVSTVGSSLERLIARPKTRPNSKKRHDFKVLVVENSVALRTLVVAALQRRFHVVGAAHGREALTCLAEKPDMLLIGLHLPHGDYGAVIRKIRQAAKEVPIMLMCDPETKDLLEDIEGLGIQAIFLKPFSPTDILAEIEAFYEKIKCT